MTSGPASQTPAVEGENGADPSGRGVVYGLAAYALWGTMPLYFRALLPTGPWEILAHRMVWSLLFCLVLLALTSGFAGLAAALRGRRQLGGLVAAGLLVSINWAIYLVAVTSGHITEAALGYFLNPLVSVALGLLVLGERLRPMQWAAVAVGACGGVFLAVTGGAIPLFALGLAFSFGFYGLVKKRLGVRLSALQSLTAETAVVTPVAVVILAWHVVTGSLSFGAAGPAHSLLLTSTGLMTAIPLLLFAAAARRVPLVTIGLLQFVAPVLQFAAGLALGETMTPTRWVGFAIVWMALVLLVADSATQASRRRALRPTGRGATQH